MQTERTDLGGLEESRDPGVMSSRYHSLRWEGEDEVKTVGRKARNRRQKLSKEGSNKNQVKERLRSDAQQNGNDSMRQGILGCTKERRTCRSEQCNGIGSTWEKEDVIVTIKRDWRVGIVKLAKEDNC